MSQRKKSASCLDCGKSIYPVCKSTERYFTGRCKPCSYAFRSPFKGGGKICCDCKKLKSLAEYGRRSDGRVRSECAPCYRKYMHEYRSTRLLSARAAQAKWSKTHAKQIAKKKTLRYRTDPQYRKKVVARSLLCSAVKRNHIKRLPCEECGNEKSHGHHEDYNKPLVVRWLCQRCHLREHGCAV